MATFFTISQSVGRITPVIMTAAIPAQVCYHRNFYETGPWSLFLSYTALINAYTKIALQALQVACHTVVLLLPLVELCHICLIIMHDVY